MRSFQLQTINEQTTILIGWGLLNDLLKKEQRKIILLVDENILKLYSNLFSTYSCIAIPVGEKNKTLDRVVDIHRQLIDHEVDRSYFVVGIGGGLTTDIVGFVASTYMRGVDFGFISTTLLGQVDASIGGKNGVNLDGFKNMIGTFRQPEFVWCDLTLLGTLDSKELISGLAEVVKYGAIRNNNLLHFIEENKDRIIQKEAGALEHIVGESAKIKIEIVTSDALEKGERKLLNFGHTFGHAIEKLSGMLHGEAISIGMVMAAKISVRLSSLSGQDAERLEHLLIGLGLPVRTGIPVDEIFDTLLRDKKRDGGMIHLILLQGLGNSYVKEIELTKLRQILYDLY